MQEISHVSLPRWVAASPTLALVPNLLRPPLALVSLDGHSQRVDTCRRFQVGVDQATPPLFLWLLGPFFPVCSLAMHDGVVTKRRPAD